MGEACQRTHRPCGEGVHVVTVNDYLARRDAEWVGQPLRFLGMSVGVVQNLGPNKESRKKSVFFHRVFG